ncbi:MAG: MASE3 domain-containing protein [Sulfuricurvum sp.]|nr:MASE3 domain-containing protein [Sulfuricurvum sp.]
MNYFKKYDPIALLLPVVLIALLGIIRMNEGYLLFHVIVELFAVIVGIIIAVIAYYMHTFTRNNFLLMLGIGFFWVAFLDLFHMLSYHGMNLYSDALTPNTATTLWIFARILWIVTILMAPFILFKRVTSGLIFSAMGAISIFIYIATFTGVMPIMYSSEGLTQIKIGLEYAVIAFSLFAMWIYSTKKNTFNPTMYRMIQLSLIFGIAAEICFTIYVDIYGVMNFTGHIFKFFSYWMIFQGIIVAALKEPFSVMAKVSNTYDTIPVSVVVADAEGIVRQVNRATTRCFVKTSEELVGQDNHDILHPHGVNKSECKICQAIERKIQTTVEVAFGKQHKQYTVSPIEIDGQVTGTLQICTDMTERKNFEDALLYEKETAQNYLDIVDVMLLVIDMDKKVQLLNRRGCEIIGYDFHEVVGKNWIKNFLPVRFQQEIIDITEKFKSYEKVASYYENPILTKNGEERLIAWRNTPLFDQDNHFIGILCSGEDVTERRQAQQKIKESEEFYRSIFSSVNESILILHNNVVTDCNELALELFEKEKEQLIGIDIFDLADKITCRNESMDFYLDSAYLGSDVIAECSLTLHTKETKVVEFTLSGLGAVAGDKLVMIARDMTKKIESEKLFKLQTRQAQMGEMISMIAHQWRQPLAIINAITTQMRFKEYMNGNEDSIEQNNLIKIEDQCTHLSQTISEYRDFFRPDKPKEYFQLSLLLKHALNLIEHTLKNQGIDIEEVIQDDPKIFTYRNEILQVLIALLKNSLDAFEGNELEYGKITITLSSDDDYCILSIHDNAGGITSENMQKLFIPYFTTKNKNDGTGLGLYMSKMIIQDHCQGELDVHSQNNETVFTIKIPYEKDEHDI